MKFSKNSTLGIVYRLMQDGKSCREIAKELNKPEWKIKRHLCVIKNNMNCGI